MGGGVATVGEDVCSAGEECVEVQECEEVLKGLRFCLGGGGWR
jgi:hypothetical protein